MKIHVEAFDNDESKSIVFHKGSISKEDMLCAVSFYNEMGKLTRADVALVANRFKELVENALKIAMEPESRIVKPSNGIVLPNRAARRARR